MGEAAFKVVDIKIDNKAYECGVKELAKHLRPAWSSENLDIKKFEGGVCNLMLHVHNQNDDGDITENDMVVRIYNADISESVISRHGEFVSMQISQAAGCQPEIYATFKNGLVYKYFPGRCATMHDVLKENTIRSISKRLARFHCTDIDKVSVYDVAGRLSSAEDKKQMVFWQKLRKHINEIPAEIEDDEERNQRYQREKLPSHELHSELTFMENAVRSVDMKTCLSHCDFHLYNILLNEDSDDVMFCDYEVSGAHYETWDLNYLFGQRGLMEDLGRVTSEEPYLTDEARREFLRSYLNCKYELQGKNTGDIDAKAFRMFELHQQILYPLFFLYWVITAQRLCQFKGIDCLLMIPRMKSEYFKLKSSVDEMVSEYKNLKDSSS